MMTMVWKYLVCTILLSVLVHSSNGQPVSSNGQPDQRQRFTSVEAAQEYANKFGQKGEKIVIVDPNGNEQIFTIGGSEETKDPDAKTKPAPNSGAQPSKPQSLKEVYTNEIGKMTLGTLEQLRQNAKSINKMADAQNNWNIQQYDNVRQRIAAAGNNLVQKSQEFPVIGTIVDAVANWVFGPIAQVNDKIWYGAKNGIDATVQQSTKTLKQAKSFTQPSVPFSSW